MMRAIRSGEAWLAGLLVLVGTGSIGVAAGFRMLGVPGAVGGGVAGVCAAMYVFFRVVVQWKARRLLPIVEREMNVTAEFGEAIRAQDRLKRIVAEDSGRRVHEPRG